MLIQVRFDDRQDQSWESHHFIFWVHARYSRRYCLKSNNSLYMYIIYYRLPKLIFLRKNLSIRVSTCFALANEKIVLLVFFFSLMWFPNHQVYTHTVPYKSIKGRYKGTLWCKYSYRYYILSRSIFRNFVLTLSMAFPLPSLLLSPGTSVFLSNI